MQRQEGIELQDIRVLDIIEYRNAFYRVREDDESIVMLNGIYTFCCDVVRVEENGKKITIIEKKPVSVVIGPESLILHFKIYRLTN
jgi:hypothetical protein